jgi:hypothetical protein
MMVSKLLSRQLQPRDGDCPIDVVAPDQEDEQNIAED